MIHVCTCTRSWYMYIYVYMYVYTSIRHVCTCNYMYITFVRHVYTLVCMVHALNIHGTCTNMDVYACSVHACMCIVHEVVVGASVSEPHLRSSTRPLSVYIYISYVRHFWSRGPRATRKRKPAHLKFKGHMHACCIYVANASRAITTLIERLHMYSSSLITSSAG